MMKERKNPGRIAASIGIGLVFTLALVVTSMANSVFELGIEKTPLPNLSLTQTIAALAFNNDWLATQIHQPTLTPTREITPEQVPITDTVSPVVTVTPIVPRFSNLRFTTQPETSMTQRFYPAGIPRVFAVWDYDNMQDGLTILRIWRLNGEDYVTRSETWSIDQNGYDGTLNLISLFDEDAGLTPGEYSLSLFIDGVIQDVGTEEGIQESASFWVFPTEVRSPVQAPDRSHAAYLRFGGRLVIEYPDGSLRELVVTQEISNLVWFPDNQHILYEDRDRSKQVSEIEDWGITNKLWVLDVETGDRHLVATTGEDFHTPSISPEGSYIAALAGTTLRDGCKASPTLVILELDGELRRQAVYTINNFTGIPPGDPGISVIYPFDRSIPGVWEGPAQLTIRLSWTCLDTNANPAGFYRLNLSTMKAEQVERP